MDRRVPGLAVAVFLMLAAPAVARADDWIFFDAHPVHPAAGGGFCEEPGAHVHDYAPIDPAAFVRRDGLWFFVGDPVTYGYRGPVYRFEGAHEVPGAEGFATCTLSGVHHHLYAPAPLPPEPATAWIAVPVGGPWWWDRRPPRRAGPDRPHAYPVDPPPRAPRARRPPPPAALPRPALPSASSRRAPPPPARRGGAR